MQGMLNALDPVDTAQARRKGTRNALATMKAQGRANELQRQQAMRQAARQGGSMDQIANRLADKGYAQAANKLQQQGEQVEKADLENRLRESKYVAQRAMQVGSQAQYDQLRKEMVELRPESSEFVNKMPDEYGPEARQVLDSLAMVTERQIRQTISGEQANKMFGTELAPGAAVTVKGGPRSMSIADVQAPADQGDNTQQTISGEQANKMFGTKLAPGAAVTVEGGSGGMSIKNVQEPADQGDKTQTEREIQRYIERGFSRSVAEDIAYGNINVETDQFGNTYLVNKATGERRVLRGQGRDDADGTKTEKTEQDPIKAKDKQEQSLFKAVDETGPMAWLRSAGNNVIGPFLKGVPFEETAASKQQLRQFNYAVQQAFKQDDGRMSNYERQIIREFLPDPDRVFTDPDKERAKLREMRTFLQRQREQLKRSMDEKVTAQERGQLSNQIETIDRVLNLMGEEQTEAQYTRDNPAQPTTQEEYESLPSGAYFVDDEGLKRKP